MGLFDGIMGNASNINTDEASKEISFLLCEAETVQLAYRLIRDLIIFTDKRLILVDKQGITSKKVEYKSIPYKSIQRFSIETSGHFDLDSELKIWTSGSLEPVANLEFNKDKHIEAICKKLSEKILY